MPRCLNFLYESTKADSGRIGRIERLAERAANQLPLFDDDKSTEFIAYGHQGSRWSG